MLVFGRLDAGPGRLCSCARGFGPLGADGADGCLGGTAAHDLSGLDGVTTAGLGAGRGMLSIGCRWAFLLFGCMFGRAGCCCCLLESGSNIISSGFPVSATEKSASSNKSPGFVR